MKARLINTRFWIDNYISNLDPVEKLLFLYLLTNEHANISGIYEIPLKTIAVDTGIDKEMVIKILKRFSDDNKITYIDGWVCIKNFQKHQSQSEDVKMGIKREISNIPENIRVKLIKEDGGGTVGGGCIDGGGDLTKPNLTKPNLTAEVNSADIEVLIKSFESINPSCKKFYNNKTQRKATEELIKSFTFQRVKNVIEKTLPHTNGLQFFPTITTPLQLQDKWASLESAIRKYQSEKLLTKKYKII